jgi:hypothetical protein
VSIPEDGSGLDGTGLDGTGLDGGGLDDTGLHDTGLGRTGLDGSYQNGSGPVDLGEAARQLELAIHDARVAFDCIGLGTLDRAHTSAITARAAIDSAETLLRASLGSREVLTPDM